MGLNLLEESRNGKTTRKTVLSLLLSQFFVVNIHYRCIIKYVINKLSHDWLGDISCITLVTIS